MKVTHLVLCSLAILSMAACKKKKDTAVAPQNIAQPNVTNAIDSDAVAAHRGVDTYTGIFSDNTSGKSIAFYITHLDGKNYGKVIFRCSTGLQVADIEYGPYNGTTQIDDTIQYVTSGYFMVQDKIQCTITGTGQLGDSLLLDWTYDYDKSYYTHHICSFRGRRMK